MRIGLLLAALILSGCGDAPQAAPPRQAEAVKPIAAPPCAQPKLDFRAARLDAPNQALFSERFRAAVERACHDGLFADAPLIDHRSVDRSTLFVMNAPEANVTSIYFSPSAAPPNTLLESPFGDPPQIPSVADLHEAIYCVTKGATEKEMEEQGRCLPD
jgi:hypothetical protein